MPGESLLVGCLWRSVGATAGNSSGHTQVSPTLDLAQKKSSRKGPGTWFTSTAWHHAACRLEPGFLLRLGPQSGPQSLHSRLWAKHIACIRSRCSTQGVHVQASISGETKGTSSIRCLKSSGTMTSLSKIRFLPIRKICLVALRVVNVLLRDTEQFARSKCKCPQLLPKKAKNARYFCQGKLLT